MFGGLGGDLLSHALRRSTMGAERFHGRVRNGVGWGTFAMATKPSKHAKPVWGFVFEPLVYRALRYLSVLILSYRLAAK